MTSEHASIRTLSKKKAAKLPQVQRIEFLYACFEKMSEKNDKYGSYYGRQCLKAVEECIHPHGLKRGQVSSICRRCGGKVVVMSPEEGISCETSAERGGNEEKRFEERNVTVGEIKENEMSDVVRLPASKVRRLQRHMQKWRKRNQIIDGGVVRMGVARTCRVCHNRTYQKWVPKAVNIT